MSVSIFDIHEAFSLAEVNISNYRTVHGKKKLCFGPGVNVVSINDPGQDSYILDHILEAFPLIVGGRSLDYRDQSYFYEGRNEIELSFVFSKGSVKEEYVRRRKYRKDNELQAKVTGFTKKGNPRYEKDTMPVVEMEKIAIYRYQNGEVPKDTPLLPQIKRYMDKNYWGEITVGLYYLGQVISREAFSRSKVVVIGPNVTRYMFDRELIVATRLLRFLDKQVVFLYNNPCDFTQNQRVIETSIEQDYNYIPIREERNEEEDLGGATVRMAARELIARQEAPLADKARLSIDIIKEVFLRSRRVAIAHSFGKDSSVTMDLVKRALVELREQFTEAEIPNPILCFGDTRVEFPEHYQFAKEQRKLLEGEGFEVYFAQSEMTMGEVFDKYGFPIFGKEIRQPKRPKLYDRLRDLDVKYCGNNCCRILKEEPSEELYQRLGIDAIITGITAVESNNRRQYFYRWGDINYAKSQGRLKGTPIIHFTEDDIWAYINKHDIPVSPLYSTGYDKQLEDGSVEHITYPRTGCYVCGMAIQYPGNNLEMLLNTHIDLWYDLMRKGMGKEIYKFKKGIAEDEWNKHYEDEVDALLKGNPEFFTYVGDIDALSDIQQK